MNGYDTHDEQQPVTWIGGRPVYAAHILVLVFVVSALFTTLLQFGREITAPIMASLVFDSRLVLRGEVWRVITYGFLNAVTLRFVIDMAMLFMFGRELEKFFGRRKFLQFYATLYLLPPALFTVIGLWRSTTFYGQTGTFAVFIAFATLYPNAMMMFNILAKWVALVLVAVFALMAIAARDWNSLLSLAATAGFAFAFVRYQQGRFALPSLRFPRRKPRFQVLTQQPESPRGSPAKNNTRPPRAVRDVTTSEMDALLDKIARSGMHSLTPEERARLDAAAKAHTQRKFGR